MQLQTEDVLNFREEETGLNFHIKSFVKQEGSLPESRVIESNKLSGGLPSGLQSKGFTPTYEDAA